MENKEIKIVGKGNATASLVLGIISIASTFTGIGAIIGIVLGIIGISQGNKSMKLGFEGGMAKAGKVCSIVGLCISGVVVVFAILGLGLLAGGGLALAAAF